MGKLIIHNGSNLPDTKALAYVGAVVDRGRLSQTSKGSQYCLGTTFEDGIVVSSRKNELSDTFYVYEEKRSDNE